MIPVAHDLNEMIPKIHRTANPLRFGLRIQQLELIWCLRILDHDMVPSTSVPPIPKNRQLPKKQLRKSDESAHLRFGIGFVFFWDWNGTIILFR